MTWKDQSLVFVIGGFPLRLVPVTRGLTVIHRHSLYHGHGLRYQSMTYHFHKQFENNWGRTDGRKDTTSFREYWGFHCKPTQNNHWCITVILVEIEHLSKKGKNQVLAWKCKEEKDTLGCNEMLLSIHFLFLLLAGILSTTATSICDGFVVSDWQRKKVFFFRFTTVFFLHGFNFVDSNTIFYAFLHPTLRYNNNIINNKNNHNNKKKNNSNYNDDDN